MFRRGHAIWVEDNGNKFQTFEDILPKSPCKILFIAKTPAPKSVEKGHYFQGSQGKSFWNKLVNYGLFAVPDEEYEDDQLIKYSYGITDIVKIPRNYGKEPSEAEYVAGLPRILNIIERLKPEVIVFIYKKVLDVIMRNSFNITTKSVYGYNETYNKYFKSIVFVFPMPGTPCTSEEAHKHMLYLKNIIR